MVALKTKTSKATKTSETTRTPEQVAKSELYDTSHQLHNLQQLDRDRCKAVANALNELDGYLVGIRQDLDDLFHLTREALDKAIDVAMPVDKAKWEQDRLEAHEHFAGLLSSVRAAERYSATINTECSKRVVSA